jgi:hypothetical protein
VQAQIAKGGEPHIKSACNCTGRGKTSLGKVAWAKPEFGRNQKLKAQAGFWRRGCFSAFQKLCRA